MTDPAGPRPEKDRQPLGDWLSRLKNGAGYWVSDGAAPRSPVGRQVRDHWIAQRGDRKMPARRDLDPLDITFALPHIVLVDILDGGAELRYRLIGTFVTEVAGRDATGRVLDAALYGSKLDAVLWPYLEVVRTQAPVAVLSGVLFADRDWHCVENMFLPFGNEADGMDTIACCVDINREHTMADTPNGLILDWRR